MTFRNLLNLPFARLELRREEGQTMAEYGVVLAVITIAAVAAFVALGDRIDDVIRAVITRMPLA